MEVILKQDFPSLGYVGERVSVRRGYARNYLVPRGIAVEVASHNARLLAHKVAGINAHRARLKKVAEDLASQLSSVKLDFVMKLGTQGKSFGAVTLKDIELALEARGFKLDRRQLRLAEAIKAPGEYEVGVKLHSEVSLSIPVLVTAEKPPVVEAAAGEGKDAQHAGREKGRRRGRSRAHAEDAGEEESGAEKSNEDSSE